MTLSPNQANPSKRLPVYTVKKGGEQPANQGPETDQTESGGIQGPSAFLDCHLVSSCSKDVTPTRPIALQAVLSCQVSAKWKATKITSQTARLLGYFMSHGSVRGVATGWANQWDPGTLQKTVLLVHSIVNM